MMSTAIHHHCEASRKATWLVCVDGSDVSRKALDVACNFIRQDGTEDDLQVFNAYNIEADRRLSSSHNHEQLKHELNLQVNRAKTTYDVGGPLRLKTTLIVRPEDRGKNAIESILNHINSVKPTLSFCGSFGMGGEKVEGQYVCFPFSSLALFGYFSFFLFLSLSLCV